MKPYSSENVFVSPCRLLILFGGLIALQGSRGEDAPCREILEDYCCRGKTCNSRQLNMPQKYCTIKGYCWGKGCKNVNQTTNDGRIIGRKMLNKRKGGAWALGRIMNDIAATADNHRQCLFGTEPWCISMEPCGDRDQPFPDIFIEPPESEDPDVIEQFCRGFSNDWVVCREQPYCMFICATGICQRTADSNVERACPHHCFDACQCKHHGCEYSVATGACTGCLNNPDTNYEHQAEHIQVEKCDTNKFNDSCLRENALYSLGGVICESKTHNKKCEVDEIIQAVNLNGPSISDQYNIVYRDDGLELNLEYEDPYNIRQTGTADEVIDTTNREKSIYKTYVYGGENAVSQGKCLTYLFTISQDGKYLLGLKVVELWNDVKLQRRFNVLLNDVLILPEIDVLKYTKHRNSAKDIFVNFQVKKDKDASFLHIQGFPPVKLVDDHFRLSLCPGTCTNRVPDNRFQLSAFSVVRLRSNEVTVICKRTTDPCECRRDGCQWDSNKNECIEDTTACGRLAYIGESEDCVRAGAYYISGGTWCQMKQASGNCTNTEINAFGINFNGLNYTDSRGITYFAENQIEDSINNDFDDRVGSTTAGYCNTVVGVTEEDSKYLYSTVIHGRIRNHSGIHDAALRTSCVGVGYPLPVCADGRYELSIKTVESYWDSLKIRSFNIRLTGLDSELIMEVDLVKLNKRCHATELIIYLEVDSNQKRVLIEGHEQMAINKRQLEIRFCQGNCEFFPDQAYQVSALSLVRIGDIYTPSVRDDPCIQYSGDMCACRNNPQPNLICEHNNVTGDCFSMREECTLCDIPPGQCRRKYIFYANQGVLCQNLLQGGNCREGETIIALWLGQPIILKGRSRLSPLVTPERDCVQYDVKVKTDGWYELQISLGDFTLHDEKQRTFTLVFNGVYIVQEMDIVKYSIIVSIHMKLNVNFKVVQDGTLLQIAGYPDSRIEEKEIPMVFCLGDCRPSTDNDYVWQLNSFNVVKILEKGDPGYENATNHGDDNQLGDD